MGKIIGEGKCKKCGEKIRWCVTEQGNFQPIQMHDNEPHFPHCGKGSWTANDWAEMMIETGKKILAKNKGNNRTKKRGKKSFYSGERPPWDYPTYISCIE